MTMAAMPDTLTTSTVEVPLLDLKAQYETIEREVIAAIRETCSSQRFILGPKVDELEKKIAAYSQCQFGIGVSSGTDALLVALMALDVGPGDEVITTPYSFFATAGAIARLGARPLFCDIDPTTYNLSPAAVKTMLESCAQRRDGQWINRNTGGRIKVIMPVHLFGQMADMDGLMAIAREYQLKVIEDAAQAIGSEYRDGRRAGSIGDIGCFSFFPSKNLGAFGDGGLCTTNDAALAERLKVLRAHGSKPKYYHAMIGGNFRLDELQAAVLLVKLPYLDAWTTQRQKNASFYDRALAGISGLQTPHLNTGRHIYNQYILRTAQRDALKSHLTKNKIGTEVYYPVPLHNQECFEYLGYVSADAPESSLAAIETLAIPIFPELSGAQKQRVVDVVSGFFIQAK
jgi:dTDP-4-amino-4,6-dideoxygalactose transaminase